MVIPLRGVFRGMRGSSPGRFISVAGREAPGYCEHCIKKNIKENKEDRSDTPGQDYIKKT